jgi:hypothetical protein
MRTGSGHAGGLYPLNNARWQLVVIDVLAAAMRECDDYDS